MPYSVATFVAILVKSIMSKESDNATLKSTRVNLTLFNKHKPTVPRIIQHFICLSNYANL